jgi:uncharacterized membrane protein
MAIQFPKKKIATISITLTAMWATVLLISSTIPAYPVLGTAAVITFSSILLVGLTAVLLGPFYGALSGLIFGLLVPYINPSASIGILTFLAPTMAALMGGLVLFNRWKEAALILVIQIGIWVVNPFSWYQLMPLVLWQFIPVFIFILVPPVRNWIIKTIVNMDRKYLPVALWCLAFIARIGGEVATGNNIGIWVLGWTGEGFYPYWAPMTLYYAIADSINCLVGAVIGTGVLIALQSSNLHVTAVDHLREKLNQRLKPITG